MKIVQNPISGEINIQLDRDEKYDTEEDLEALTNFVFKKALEIHQLTNSYKKLSERLDALEKLSKLKSEVQAD
jgi:flagellin-specific chaperone FliS